MEYKTDSKRYRVTPRGAMAVQASAPAPPPRPPPPPTGPPTLLPLIETSGHGLARENAHHHDADDVIIAAAPTNTPFLTVLPEDLKKTLEQPCPVEEPAKVAGALASAWHNENAEVQNLAFVKTVQLLSLARSSRLKHCVDELLFIVRSAVKHALKSTSVDDVELLLPSLLKMVQDVCRSDPSELTALDTEFVRLCVEADMHARAGPVIDRQIFRVKKGFCDSVNVCIEYFYLSGLVWSQQRAYKKAFYSFDQALSFPCVNKEAQGLHETCETHLLLLSIILYGRVLSPESSTQTQRSGVSPSIADVLGGRLLLQRDLSPYIVKVPHMLLHLKQQLQQSQQLLQQKRGWPLACAAVEALELRVMMALGSRFDNIPLDAFQRRLGFPSLSAAQQFIEDMQQKGACTFDKERLCVRFATFSSSSQSGSTAAAHECRREAPHLWLARGVARADFLPAEAAASLSEDSDSSSDNAREGEAAEKEEGERREKRRGDAGDTEEKTEDAGERERRSRMRQERTKKSGGRPGAVGCRRGSKYRGKCGRLRREEMKRRVQSIIQRLVDATRELELAQENLHAS